MPLSVCIIARSIPPYEYGGIETYTLSLAHSLNRLGCDVSIICKKSNLYNKNYLELNGLKVFFVKSDFFLSDSVDNLYFSIKAMKKIIDFGKFDIIHGQYIYGFGYALIKTLAKMQKPFINTIHNLIIRDMSLSLKSFSLKKNNLFVHPYSVAEYLVQAPLAFAEIKLIAKKATKLIAVSENTKKDCVKLCKISNSKIFTIPNGVDIEKFSPFVSGNNLRNVLGLSSNPIILYVGGIDARKGLDCLAYASKKVLSHFNDAKFVVVGKGPRENHFKELLKKLKIFNSYVFLQNINNQILPSIYSIADVFVLPSFWEGFGISLTEAMSTGLPVISSNISAIPEIIVNNENGLLSKPGDSNNLSELIITLLLDKQLRKKLGTNARKTMEKYFSWNIVSRKTLQVYEDSFKE